MQAAGFVLAGGMSSRMGRDKAMLEFEGDVLVRRALRTLTEVCGAVAIAGGTGLEQYGRVISDGTPGRGPLGGIVAALEQTEAEWNVFLPVDTPFVPAVALRRLLAVADAGCVGVFSALEGQVQPLCAVYSRRALGVVRGELAADRRKVRTAIEAAGLVRVVEFAAAEAGWFRNLNTPADLQEAARAGVNR